MLGISDNNKSECATSDNGFDGKGDMGITQGHELKLVNFTPNANSAGATCPKLEAHREPEHA